MKRKAGGWVRWIIFLVYAGWLLWLLLFRRLGSAQVASLGEYTAGHLGLVPLRTISNQAVLALKGDRHAISNLGGNLLLFVPVGVFLPSLFRSLRPFPAFLAAFVGSIIVVELCQLFLRIGFCEIDDVLLNTVGAVMGYVIWKRKGS